MIPNKLHLKCINQPFQDNSLFVSSWLEYEILESLQIKIEICKITKSYSLFTIMTSKEFQPKFILRTPQTWIKTLFTSPFL